MMPNRPILILHNAPREGGGDHAESEAGVLEEVAHVAAALDELKVPYRVASARTLRDVGRTLEAAAEHCVVNLVESLEGATSDACLVPAVCTALGKAWTGSGSWCQLLALDKWQSKCALRAAGVAVPKGVVAPPGRITPRTLAMTPPVIVKPLCADASEGIDEASVIIDADPDALCACIRQIHDRFGQPALVERYVDGREFNVSVVERDGVLRALPLAEIDFSAFPAGKPRIVDYRAKWIEDSFEFGNTPRRFPADVDEDTALGIRTAALAAWTAMGCRDYARIDMRLGRDGVPYVIEVNPNPDISPEAGFAAALQAGGTGFAEFVRILLENAGTPVAAAVDTSAVEAGGGGVSVRRVRTEDRERILDMVQATGVFRHGELAVARELLDEALAAGDAGHYQSYAALRDGTVAGWTCFGPTPCTAGTFDLYWLAVHPAQHGQGVGTALLARAEADIRARSGRLIVVETSSRMDYEPARCFYTRHGYRPAGAVSDFYEKGDDKLVFVKALS